MRVCLYFDGIRVDDGFCTVYGDTKLFFCQGTVVANVCMWKRDEPAHTAALAKIMYIWRQKAGTIMRRNPSICVSVRRAYESVSKYMYVYSEFVRWALKSIFLSGWD